MSINKEKDNNWYWWIVISYFGIAVAFLTLFSFWNKIPPQIPWFYSLPWGEQQLISKTWFAIALGITTVSLTVIGWLAKILTKQDIEAGTLLARGVFIIIILYLLSFFQVLRLMLGI